MPKPAKPAMNEKGKWTALTLEELIAHGERLREQSRTVIEEMKKLCEKMVDDQKRRMSD
jgi:hypothetical protein